MDASDVTALIKELNEAGAAGKTEDLTRILGKLKTDVVPTEELLKISKAGLAVGKLRSNAAPGVSSLAREIVKAWKDIIEENKRKRKRDEGDEGGEVKKEGGEKSEKAGEGSKRVKKEEDGPSVQSPTAVPDSKSNDNKPSTSTSASPPQRPPLSTIDSSRAQPRTAAEDGIESTLRASTSERDDVRDKCVVMMYNGLAADSTAEKRILTERAVGIEKAVYEQFDGTSKEYRAKIRSLFLNLKDKGNPGLRNEIVLGYISVGKLANMSKDEMASESVRAMKEKIASDNLFKAKAVGETQAETDAFKCGRCQQRKCTYYQMQTRSADEPMTTFVTCTNCNNRWKFS